MITSLSSTLSGAERPLKLQKDKRYRRQIRINPGVSEKPLYKWITAHRKSEYEEKTRRVIARFVDNSAVDDNADFCRYVSEWYRLKKEPFISKASRDVYDSVLSCHILPFFRSRMMRSITHADLQQYANLFTGRSKSLIGYIVSIIHAVFTGACAEGLIPRDVSAGLVRPKPSKPKKRREFTADERSRILFASKRGGAYAMLAILYYTGVRRGEMLGLKWKDIRFGEGIVSIERDIDYRTNAVGELKSDAAVRFVPMCAALESALRPLRGFPEAFVFQNRYGKYLSESTFRRIWIRLMLACDMPIIKLEPKKNKKGDIRNRFKCIITPHYFRHDFASRLPRAGVRSEVAKYIMGHAEHNTTINYYTHINIEDVRLVCSMM